MPITANKISTFHRLKWSIPHLDTPRSVVEPVSYMNFAAITTEPGLRRASRLVLLDGQRPVLLFQHAERNEEAFWAPQKWVFQYLANSTPVPLTVPGPLPPSGLARFARSGIIRGRSLLCGKRLRGFCSGNCRVALFVGVPFFIIQRGRAATKTLWQALGSHAQLSGLDHRSSPDILLQFPEIQVLASLRTKYKLRGVPRLPNTRTRLPVHSPDFTA